MASSIGWFTSLDDPQEAVPAKRKTKFEMAAAKRAADKAREEEREAAEFEASEKRKAQEAREEEREAAEFEASKKRKAQEECEAAELRASEERAYAERCAREEHEAALQQAEDAARKAEASRKSSQNIAATSKYPTSEVGDASILPLARETQPGSDTLALPSPSRSEQSPSSLNGRSPFPLNLDFITLKVEDMTFRIDCKLVQDSSHFMDLLEATRFEPITLRNVTADDMECFLRLLNARVLDPIPYFTSDELATLLRLGTMWDFPSIRNFAIKEIDSKLATLSHDDPVDRIELAKKCFVYKWLEPAYLELCTQPTAFTAQQMQRLAGLIGWPALAALVDIRERSRICSRCNCTSLQNAAHPSQQHTVQQADQIKELVKTLAVMRM